jgi:glycosyltransferase involved in cell wall biosynthesis
MPETKITVLMPCYNAANYIGDAIQSVLNQTLGDFELLIVNDGSTDHTTECIRSFRDERIILIEQEQQGVAAALNNGLKHARAEYIARFDADDICFPERLEKQYHFMIRHPEYIVSGSGANYLDEVGNYIFTYSPRVKTDQEIRQLSSTICPFIHASVMYKKDIVAKAGYDTGAHGFEDHLLWLKIREQGKMVNFSEPLISVRLNPGSFTMDERKRSFEFRQIKKRALREKCIMKKDSDRLYTIILEQNRSKKKQGAYYSLLAKKFLWNNYNPSKARLNMKKAIRVYAFDVKDYFLLLVSYLPKNFISYFYSLIISTR